MPSVHPVADAIYEALRLKDEEGRLDAAAIADAVAIGLEVAREQSAAPGVGATGSLQSQIGVTVDIPSFDIKALIDKEDADFISLDELLTVIAAAGKGTYQNAAQLLLRRLTNADSDACPPWCRLEIDRGIVVLASSGNSFEWECLRQAAAHGRPITEDEIPF